MDIFPLGHSSFRLRGKQATLVTDPFGESGLSVKFPKHIEADIVTVSHDHADHNAVDLVGGTPFVVRGPGEYEIKGVSVIGIPSFHDAESGAARGKNTMYRIEIDGVKVAHLGDLGHVLTSAQVEQIGGIDVLMIPIGGTYTVDAEKAAQVISDIEPRIIIPMHDARSNADLVSVEQFLKQMNKEGITAVPKLTVSRDKMPTEATIVILE